MKTAERLLLFAGSVVVFVLVAFGDRLFGCNAEQREKECRDKATDTLSECRDATNICEHKAQVALDLCLGDR